jgi:hypothetical protein
MADTSLQALREHLFDVIERLKDGNDPGVDPKDTISIESANAITAAASQIINSAKVEVMAYKLIASEGERTGLENSNILKLKE